MSNKKKVAATAARAAAKATAKANERLAGHGRLGALQSAAPIINRMSDALERATSQEKTIAKSLSDRFAIPQLWHLASQNFLTHGLDYLTGPDELPLFSPNLWHAPLKWRPIPGPNTMSLSKATLTTTSMGTAMLRGNFGGNSGEVSLLTGLSETELESSPVGAGACGVGSTGHWKIDLAQHHWLELKVRTGGRAFELVVESDGFYEGSERIWRAPIPAVMEYSSVEGYGGSCDAGAGMAVTRAPRHGAYGVLNVDAEASDADIRDSYRELVMQHHPDREGGDEEKFKAISKAYALVGDPASRARYDEFGAELDEGEDADADLDDLGPWRYIKVPFTAFKDRSFFHFNEKVSTVYVILAGDTEEPGPFALEIGEIKGGRCRFANLDGAGTDGFVSCEQGHCECGYYNGLRCEAFDGPIDIQKAGGRLPRGPVEWGHAEHHLRKGEFRAM